VTQAPRPDGSPTELPVRAALRIRTRLLLLVLTVVAPLVALTLFNAWTTVRERDADAQQRALNVARLIAARLDDRLARGAQGLSADSLRPLLESGGLPPGSVVGLFDLGGRLLVRRPRLESLEGRDLSGRSFVQRAFRALEGGEDVTWADGVRRSSGHTRLRGAPLILYVGIPYDLAAAEERAELERSLLLMAAALALAFGLTWLVAEVFTRPLRRLESAAAALSAGDLGRRAEVRSADEIGELAAAFNRMAGALQKRDAELAESERHYRELFEENPLPMLVYDPESLRILAVNHAAVRHYGWTREEFLTLTITDIRPAEDVPALREFLDRVRSPHRVAGTWRHLRKDGSVRDMEITSHAIEFAGRPARIVLANDVTERLAGERAMRDFTQELERRVELRTAELQEANRELETFSYSVSHDLRAPLRSMEGFARMLDERAGPRLDAEDRRLLGVVAAAARRMTRLVDDLLAFSRSSRQPLNTTTVDLRALASEVWAEVEASAAGRTLRLKLGDLPPARGDRALLRQVLFNLLDNAAKFTRGRAVAEVAIEGRAADGEAEYLVRDNGAGFDPRHADRLFGVFQRLHTSEEFEGTGAGLAIVQRIVRRHGGRVWAEGLPGEGAVFHFTLPRA